MAPLYRQTTSAGLLAKSKPLVRAGLGGVAHLIWTLECGPDELLGLVPTLRAARRALCAPSQAHHPGFKELNSGQAASTAGGYSVFRGAERPTQHLPPSHAQPPDPMSWRKERRRSSGQGGGPAVSPGVCHEAISALTSRLHGGATLGVVGRNLLLGSKEC